MFRLLSLIAMLVAGLQHTDTLAQSSATARFDALQYSLVDLDVADGIEPSVQFYSGDLTTYARLWNADTGQAQEQSQTLEAPWGPTSVQLTATHGQVTASINESSSFLDRARMNLASHTYHRPISADYLWARNEARVGTGQVTPFILSPKTEIHFVLPVTLGVEIVGGYVNESLNVDWAVAQAGITFDSAITAERASSVLRVDGIPTPYSGALVLYSGSSNSRVVDLRASVTNAASDPLDTAIYSWLEAEAWAYVSAVPEPEVISLWILGLLVVGIKGIKGIRVELS